MILTLSKNTAPAVFTRVLSVLTNGLTKTARLFFGLLFIVMLSLQSQAQMRLRQATNWGGGHWTTFDGIRYNYYALGVQLFADNGKTGDEAFRAEMLKVHSVPNDPIVWSKDFAFQIGQDRVLITQETLSGVRDNAKLFINGEEKPMMVGQSYDLPSRPIINGLEATRKIQKFDGRLIMTIDIGVNDTDGNSYTETLDIIITFQLRGAQPYGDINLRTNVMGTDYGPIGSNNNNPADDVCDAACQINTISVPFETSLFAEPDTTPPFVDFGSEFTLELDENGHAAVTIDAVGGDEFDDNGDPLTFAFSQTDFDCSNLAAPTAVTITVTNAAGISASTVMNANVVDNVGPTLVTNHVVVQLDAEGNGSYTNEELFSAETRDNCGGPISFQGAGTVNRDDVAASPFEVVVKGTDQNGNTTRSRATITVLDYVADVTPPVVIAKDITVELDENGNASITAEDIDNGSADDSGGELSYALSQTDFSCNELSVSCSGSSIEFNGTGIASGANGDNIQNLGLNQLTMEAWVKPNGGTVNSIIRKAGDYDLYIANNTLYAEVWYEGRASSAQYLYTGPSVSNNAWSHLAFTFDKANGSAGKFYVNGLETVATGTARSITQDITLGIGGSTEFGQSFTGLIDDVRIWSVERTNAQINEFKDFCIDANSVGLEAYFKIEANEGTSLTDYSGNGNDLTITGASWSSEGAPIESKGVEVILTVTDESNNVSSATASVIVLDNLAPTIDLNGDASVVVALNTTFNDPSAAVADNCSATLVTTGTLDTSVADTYTLTYKAVDASGNESASVTRTVTVVAPPVVAINAVDDVICAGEETTLSVASDLVGYWNFNEGTGTTVNDVSGNNANGEFVGNLTWRADSPISGGTSSLNFNGAYVNVPDNPRFDDLQNELSIEAWIYQTDAANNTIIDRGNYNFLLETMPNGQPGMGFYNVSGGWSYSTTAIEVNQWVHLAMTWEKSTRTLKFYKNGVLTDTFVRQGDLNFFEGGPINIGRQSPYTCLCNPMNGAMEEVRLWNSVRTQEEILDNMNAPIDVSSPATYTWAPSTGLNTTTGPTVEANPAETTTYTVTATDAYGFTSTATQTITVNTAPVVVVPVQAVIVNRADGIATYNVDVTGDPEPLVTYTFSGATTGSGEGIGSGSVFNLGTTTVSITATNDCAASTETFNVEVLDVQPPVITAPADISTLATSAAGAIVNYVTPVGTDNGTVTTVLTEGFASGATFPIGATTVTYTATDGSGNTASASFNVEVAGLAPEIITPSNITVSTDGGECGATVTYIATETTAIPASTITYDIQPGSSFAPGTTTVTATATNPLGTSTKTFTVTVEDNEAPTIPVSSGSSGVSLPGGNSNGWSPWVHDFNLPIPDGAIVTGVDMNFNAVDQGWGGTGAYATFEIQGQTIGTAQLFHSEQNYNINYSGSIDGYVNSGNNQLKMFFQGYSGWVAYFRGGSMTISYTVQGNRANDLTVYLDASGNASVLPSQIDPGVTDNCSLASVTLDQSSFNCSNIGANEVNLIAVDINGNESTFAATITVIDEIAPTVTAKDISVVLDASGKASITAQDVLLSGADNCGPVTYTLSQDTFGVQDALNSPVTIQLTGADPSGNATSVDVQVTVIDPIPVVLTQDITVSLDENGNAMITPEQIDDGSSSIIGLAGLALDITSFDCSNVGTPVTVTLTATSTSGSSASATAVVTVEDNAAPEFLTRESFIIYLDANGVATVTPDQFNRETVADNCGVETITFDKTTFNCDERGFHVINITATDARGNATVGQADVEVRDEIAPTVITKNIIVDLDENGNATISPSDVDGGTFDNCAFTLSLNIDSFTCDQVGENIVELTAQDQNGVFASANATVTVRDVTAPEFLTRESFIIYLDENGVATVTPDQFNRETVADNCGVETITFDKTTFNCDERGFHVINITATDASGNATVGQADVEVRDEIAPTVITKNIIVDLDENGNATISPSDVDGGTFDNCAFTLSLNIQDFSCAQIGENIVELTAQDQNGVFASADATVTVRDIIAPTVITKDVTVELDTNGTYTVTPDDINNGTFDNCTFDLSVVNNVFDCSTLGENTVILTATDASGNTTSASAVVTVVDNAGPVIVVKNIDVFLDENGNASITLDDVNGGVTDGCGVTSTTIDITSFDCSNLGANAVTLTATDIHGNTSTATATVTVIDDIAPTVVTKNITVNLDARGNATISPEDVLVQEETTEYCSVANARTYGMLLYRYIKRYRRSSDRRVHAFVFSANGRTFTKNPDGTATITGTLRNSTDLWDGWVVKLNLKNASDWEEWNALGRTFIGNRNLVGDKYLDWTYYEMGEGSSLTGTGRNRGETIQLISNGGFQVGEGANTLNSSLGVIGQFRYFNRRGQRSTGRFNFDLNDCISYTNTPEGPLTDDNCEIASTSLDIASFDCSNIGDNVVNVTVTDESGNATTVPATVTVRDVTAPVVRAQSRFYAILGSNGTVTIDPKQLDAGSRDNCGIVSYSLSKDTFDCGDIYFAGWGQNVRFTVTDAAGNSSSTLVNVVVSDIEAPVISTEPITLVVYDRRRFQVSRRDIGRRITDNCGVSNFYNQRRSFTSANAGLNYLWVVATDKSGKRTFGYVVVNVVDLTNTPRRVEVCFQDQTRIVSKYGVQRLLSRGAKLGPCGTDLAMTTGGMNLDEAIEREVTAEPLIELGAFPNPSKDQTTIKFSSDVAGPATVAVVSASGVRLTTLFDGEIAANENMEVNYNTSSLPSGVYVVRLVTAGKIRNLKLMIRK